MLSLSFLFRSSDKHLLNIPSLVQQSARVLLVFGIHTSSRHIRSRNSVMHNVFPTKGIVVLERSHDFFALRVAFFPNLPSEELQAFPP